MTIETETRAALAALAASEPWLAVTVEYNAESATGVRVLTDKQTEGTPYGQAGSVVSTVRVSSAAISEPTRGALVKVGGEQVYVLGCRTSGGLRVLSVSNINPVEGV